MGKSKNANGKDEGKKAPAKKGRKGKPSPAPPRGYLIRMPDREARLRAVVALGDSREAYSGFTDYRFLITPGQFEILRRENIPFEILS